MTNPFDIGNALKLAMLIGIVMVLAKVASSDSKREGAIAPGSAVRHRRCRRHHTVDGTHGGRDGAEPRAADVILIAVGVNTIAKAVMAAIVGGRKIGTAVGIPSLAAVVLLGLARLL